MPGFKVGILTSSDLGSRGEREDVSGPLSRDMIAEIGMSPVKYVIVPGRRGC